MEPRHGNPSPSPAALARRLRDLRTGRWPGTKITQRTLGIALEVSPALVSSWESASDPAVPPVSRLLQYATLFATHRSLHGDRLRMLPDEELTPEELAVRDELHGELLLLRGVSNDPAAWDHEAPHSTWHFPDGAPIRLICGRVPAESAGAYADSSNANYTRLHALADPDALIELFGHIRMTNPESDVRFLFGDEMLQDDMTAHVVLIGGLRLNPAARYFARASQLPVRQVEHESVENGEVFELERGGRRRHFLPTFVESDPALGLVEDVALFARMPNPNFIERTLTICNGVFSRGVVGAVRTLTDAQLRDRNEAYLAERFAGLDEYGLLLRVPVFLGEAATPDLASDYHRLYVWPSREEPA
jgi:hypothetical protein